VAGGLVPLFAALTPLHSWCILTPTGSRWHTRVTQFKARWGHCSGQWSTHKEIHSCML